MELDRAEHFGIKTEKYPILVVSRLWFSAPQLLSLLADFHRSLPNSSLSCNRLFLEPDGFRYLDPFRRYSRSKSTVVRNRAELRAEMF